MNGIRLLRAIEYELTQAVDDFAWAFDNPERGRQFPVLADSAEAELIFRFTESPREYLVLREARDSSATIPWRYYYGLILIDEGRTMYVGHHLHAHLGQPEDAHVHVKVDGVAVSRDPEREVFRDDAVRDLVTRYYERLDAEEP